MLVLLIFLFSLCGAVTMLWLAAVSDFKSFTIPNHYSLVVASLFCLAFLSVTLFTSDVTIFLSFTSHLMAFAVTLGITALMYALKLLGAGDSKLMASVGLWLGLTGLVPFLFYMSVAGGVLAGVTLYLKKKPMQETPLEGSWIDTSQKGENRLPYGIAIAFGGVMAFLMNGYFSPSSWISFVQ
jgi:prepilin peptidase CpaA